MLDWTVQWRHVVATQHQVHVTSDPCAPRLTAAPRRMKLLVFMAMSHVAAHHRSRTVLACANERQQYQTSVPPDGLQSFLDVRCRVLHNLLTSVAT